jgi:PAS domain S-box-containing protein
MNCPLRVLYLEDDIADAELARDTLELDGFVCDVTRVETESVFRAALQQGGFDVILADYALPSFDGLSALKITLQQRPELPFIFVSGTMGEEVAIEALKLGATDYVLKTRLSRLAPSVNRALHEARDREGLRRAEEALRRSEAYLAIAQSLSHTGSFGWNVASGEISWSLETYRIFEVDPVTKPSLEFILKRVHPDDELSVKQMLAQISLDQADFHFEHRLLMKDGRVKYLRVSGRAAHNSSSDTDVVGAVTDVTPAKEAELELRAREAKIRRLVDANIVGVVISEDLAGRVIEANDAFLQLVRYTRDDLACGRLRWRGLTPPEWLAANARAEAQMRATGTCELFEKEYFRSDGIRVPVLVAAAAIQGTKTESVAFVLDLTERKRAEAERERLRQLQVDLAYMSRVVTVGQLAASLAHEIKQPIGAAVTNAEVCLRSVARDEPDLPAAREAALDMVKDSRRAANIVDRILSMCRKGPSQLVMVDVNEVIREMVIILRNEANRHSVTMAADLAEGLPKVRADRVQLQQVILNLMLNSIEAMKDSGGEVRLISERTEDGGLLVSVSDSGVGLTSKDAERIFEAFFTTKSQGTGMGLSISRTIIESHGGRLWATANPSRGATFHFTLPSAAPAFPVVDQPVGLTHSSKGHGL